MAVKKKSGPKGKVALRRASEKSAAAAVRRSCGLRSQPRQQLMMSDPLRARLIRRNQLKWANNETLRYMFLDHRITWRGKPADKQAVRNAFAQWKSLGIGLNFEEVTKPSDRPQIRIGFSHSRKAGSWSYVGRDAVDRIKDMRQRTMNFGWPLTDAYGYDTALHEIGHALGFEHEHQNPNAGIVWNAPACYAHYKASDGWDPPMVDDNIIEKLPQSEVSGSNWDPNSIMHYEIAPGLISQPAQYNATGVYPAGGLSAQDVSRARQFYPGGGVASATPPSLRPLRSVVLSLTPDQQADFRFVPEATRSYTIHTLGPIDTFLSVFEGVGGAEVFLVADDNSGVEENASVTLPMVAGRTYVVRVRMHYAETIGEAALVIV